MSDSNFERQQELARPTAKHESGTIVQHSEPEFQKRVNDHHKNLAANIEKGYWNAIIPFTGSEAILINADDSSRPGKVNPEYIIARKAMRLQENQVNDGIEVLKMDFEEVCTGQIFFGDEYIAPWKIGRFKQEVIMPGEFIVSFPITAYADRIAQLTDGSFNDLKKKDVDTIISALRTSFTSIRFIGWHEDHENDLLVLEFETKYAETPGNYY